MTRKEICRVFACSVVLLSSLSSQTPLDKYVRKEAAEWIGHGVTINEHGVLQPGRLLISEPKINLGNAEASKGRKRMSSSFSELQNNLGMNASAGGSYGGFEVSTEVKSALSQSKAAHHTFASHSYLVNLRKAHLDPDHLSNLKEKVRKRVDEILPELPEPTEPGALDKYRGLFNTVGSHYCTSVTFGGRCDLVMWMASKDDTTNATLSLCAQAKYDGLFKANASAEMNEEWNEVKKSTYADEAFSLSGGNEDVTINTPEQFSAWVESVKSLESDPRGPQPISYDISGIWTAFKAEKTRARIRAAYRLLSLRKVPDMRGTKYIDWMDGDSERGAWNLSFRWLPSLGNGQYSAVATAEQAHFETWQFEPADDLREDVYRITSTNGGAYGAHLTWTNTKDGEPVVILAKNQKGLWQIKSTGTNDAYHIVNLLGEKRGWYLKVKRGLDDQEHQLPILVPPPKNLAAAHRFRICKR